MAINFPNSPANGDTHVSGEKTFNYDAAKGVWNLEGNLKVALDITSTPPSSPSHGDLWMDEATGDMYTYFTDTDSSQWIQINGVGAVGAGGGSGGVTVYANFAAFPSSGNTEGDFAFATDTKAVYIWDGSEWDRISSGPQIGPRYTTTPPSQSNLSTSGATSTLTAVAVDESGFPITYDWDAYSGSTVYNSSNLPPQLTAVSENNGVFTLTPSTSESDSGEVIFRTKASDGVLFTPAITNLALIFGLENITGFVVDQTSTGNYNHTVWHAAMFNSGGSVFNDSSLRSSTTAVGYTPTSNVPEWGQGFTSNTHTVNYGPALMLNNLDGYNTKDIPVLFNPYGTRQRTSMILGTGFLQKNTISTHDYI